MSALKGRANHQETLDIGTLEKFSPSANVVPMSSFPLMHYIKCSELQYFQPFLDRKAYLSPDLDKKKAENIFIRPQLLVKPALKCPFDPILYKFLA